MCGIAGLVAKRDFSEEWFDRFVKSARIMQHRGPDASGAFRHRNVLLIHHRLSIIDLDARANQPFHSASGRFSTVYNGEIYNYRELAATLRLDLRTRSDTEVMLESFIRDESNAPAQWNGIFAGAIYDHENLRLHLFRDRLGVKPLYVYESADVLAFASEAKVILDWLPEFEIDHQVLGQFLWYGNCTGQASFVQGVRKLAPGSVLTINTRDGETIRERRFWSLENLEPVSKISLQDAVSETRRLLEQAVQRQLVADVPVGVLLSGGLDSSTITAFAARHYSGRLDTYSVEYDYNLGGRSELALAKEVANRFDTNHHELKVESTFARENFSDIVFQYDDPFADPAAIPLYQLARECSHDKKVVLQGDGGDEIFAGYRRYNVMSARHSMRFASAMYRFLPRSRFQERLKRLNFILSRRDLADMIKYYLTEEVPYSHPFKILDPNIREQVSKLAWDSDYVSVARKFQHLDPVQQLLYADTEILLPARFLEKVDKATMRWSIEARVPLLDNELVDFVLRLPSGMKVRRGQKKYLLRKAISGLLPERIMSAPKRGFDVPIRKWLRDDLYELARERFNAHDLFIFDKQELLNNLDAHRSGNSASVSLLWKALVMSEWLNHYKSKLVS